MEVERLPDGRALSALTLSELRDTCATRGLSKAGSRKILEDRLRLDLELEGLRKESTRKSQICEDAVPNIGLQNTVVGQSDVVRQYLEAQQRRLESFAQQQQQQQQQQQDQDLVQFSTPMSAPRAPDFTSVPVQQLQRHSRHPSSPSRDADNAWLAPATRCLPRRSSRMAAVPDAINNSGSYSLNEGRTDLTCAENNLLTTNDVTSKDLRASKEGMIPLAEEPTRKSMLSTSAGLRKTRSPVKCLDAASRKIPAVAAGDACDFFVECSQASGTKEQNSPKDRKVGRTRSNRKNNVSVDVNLPSCPEVIHNPLVEEHHIESSRLSPKKVKLAESPAEERSGLSAYSRKRLTSDSLLNLQEGGSKRRRNFASETPQSDSSMRVSNVELRAIANNEPVSSSALKAEGRKRSAQSSPIKCVSGEPTTLFCSKKEAVDSATSGNFDVDKPLSSRTRSQKTSLISLSASEGCHSLARHTPLDVTARNTKVPYALSDSKTRRAAVSGCLLLNDEDASSKTEPEVKIGKNRQDVAVASSSVICVTDVQLQGAEVNEPESNAANKPASGKTRSLRQRTRDISRKTTSVAKGFSASEHNDICDQNSKDGQRGGSGGANLQNLRIKLACGDKEAPVESGPITHEQTSSDESLLKKTQRKVCVRLEAEEIRNESLGPPSPKIEPVKQAPRVVEDPIEAALLALHGDVDESSNGNDSASHYPALAESDCSKLRTIPALNANKPRGSVLSEIPGKGKSSEGKGNGRRDGILAVSKGVQKTVSPCEWADLDSMAESRSGCHQQRHISKKSSSGLWPEDQSEKVCTSTVSSRETRKRSKVENIVQKLARGKDKDALNKSFVFPPPVTVELREPIVLLERAELPNKLYQQKETSLGTLSSVSINEQQRNETEDALQSLSVTNLSSIVSSGANELASPKSKRYRRDNPSLTVSMSSLRHKYEPVEQTRQSKKAEMKTLTSSDQSLGASS